MLISKRLGSLRIGKISSFTTIPNIVAVTATNITLSAQVYGDTRGHTFLWELMEGTSNGVEYLTPLNEFTLQYFNNIVIGQFDDKRFRFWIDKGTLRQQYKDVWVYGSPIDSVKYSSFNNSNSQNIVTQGSTTSINAYFSKIFINYENGTTFSGTGIEWDLPVGHDSTRFLHFQIEQFDQTTGIWNNIGIVTTIYERIFINVQINTLYRVVGVYSIDNLSVYTSQYTYVISNSIWYFESTVLPQNSWLYDSISSNIYSNSNVLNVVSGYTVNTLTKFSSVESFTASLYSNSNISNIVSGYTVNTLIKFVTPSNDIITGLIPNNSNINNTVSNFTVNSNNNLGG